MSSYPPVHDTQSSIDGFVAGVSFSAAPFDLCPIFCTILLSARLVHPSRLPHLTYATWLVNPSKLHFFVFLSRTPLDNFIFAHFFGSLPLSLRIFLQWTILFSSFLRTRTMTMSHSHLPSFGLAAVHRYSPYDVVTTTTYWAVHRRICLRIPTDDLLVRYLHMNHTNSYVNAVLIPKYVGLLTCDSKYNNMLLSIMV